ncbi:hypothetical protein [Massilia brevitalea]|uniref:hypothetical protein n=1 Tax=Massilia brevitalea TaxID=442526 RepID=UPI002739ECC6|nr:hypothetical protein [Massilia brevitalea]
MLCTVVDLCCVRVAVVRVSFEKLAEPTATREVRALQPRFGVLPIMLVAFEDFALLDAEAFAEFPVSGCLADLVDWNSMEPVEWGPLPELVEEELPF